MGLMTLLFIVHYFSQVASVMNRDQVAETVTIKENVLARRLILFGTSVINVIMNPMGFQTVKVGVTVKGVF